ncbi:hypothetical protein GCM10027019_25650 [Melaminivora jejuensis]
MVADRAKSRILAACARAAAARQDRALARALGVQHQAFNFSHGIRVRAWHVQNVNAYAAGRACGCLAARRGPSGI